MGGVMPDWERDAAIKRLRRAAEDVLRERRERRITIGPESRRLDRRTAMMRLQDAWREFPECERDDVVPSPEEVLARCDAYDRQKEEAERIAASMKQ